MDGLIKLDEELSVFTRAPDEADLEALKRGGVRSIVNLRSSGEAGEKMTPDQEGERAKGLGLSYCSVPVAPSALNADTAARVGAEIDNLSGPVVVHCASGKRAGLMALAYWARRNGASASEAAAKAQTAGLPFAEADLLPLISSGNPA